MDLDLNCLLGWKDEHFRYPQAIFFSSKFCGCRRKIIKIVPYVITFNKNLHWTLLLLCINYLCIVYSSRQLTSWGLWGPLFIFCITYIFYHPNKKLCFHKIPSAYNLRGFTAASMHFECLNAGLSLKYKLGIHVGIFLNCH